MTSLKHPGITDTANILPFEGTAHYIQGAVPESERTRLFEALQSKTSWKNDELVIFGKRIITKRMTAWYGDESVTYKYSGVVKHPLNWFDELNELKTLAEDYSQCSFNSCLLNLYSSGTEGMSWHSDDEKELGSDITICSVSLGADRRFLFRHKKTKEKIQVILRNGSLLIMKGETQFHWHHSLPKSAAIKKPRINLTFRRIVV